MGGDLELAASLVREAAQLAAAMLSDGLTTVHKTSMSDVVSAADHAAEELIVSRLRAARPADGLVGEEGTNEPAERTWFIDPVDGTYNFLSGLPLWCSALALTDAAGLVLGAVHHAATDELWLGGRGHPTTRNGVPVAPLVDRPLSDISVASYLHPTTLPDDGARIPLLRVMRGRRRSGCWARDRSNWLPSPRDASARGPRSTRWTGTGCPASRSSRRPGGVATVLETSGHRWHIAGSAQAVAEISALVRG